MLPTFELTSTQHDLNAPASPGRKENFYDVCKKIKENKQWTVVHGSDGRIGSYAYLENEWIPYDDLEDIQRRADYILKNNLGGGEITSINDDDFQDVCGCGKYPLLTALNQALRNATAPRLNNCT